MSNRRERDEFVALMTREYPDNRNLLTLLENLMRLSRHHCHLQESACNMPVPEGHDAACENRIIAACNQLSGCVPIFSGDPRGCTVKLRVPSGRRNDFGQEGVCVPQ